MAKVTAIIKKQHKKRVSKACECCRKSKTKCDGQRPCTRCLQDNKICTYLTNKKKDEKAYSSSYVDMLETRVSILIKSMSQLLKMAKTPSEISQFINEPNIYINEDEFNMNIVISTLLSTESNKKSQRHQNSNHKYLRCKKPDIQLLKASDDSNGSDSSNSNRSITSNSEISIPSDRNDQNNYKNPSASSSSDSSLSFDYPSQNPSTSMIFSAPINSIPLYSDYSNPPGSSIVSQLYSINQNDLSNYPETQDYPLNQGFQKAEGASCGYLLDGTTFDSKYFYGCDECYIERKTDETSQQIPEFNDMLF
ncbi:putative transcriptional regulatory protein [Wickerhamomyces ciferrii]|uniref:Transcriptional regulatory protein n=1 Tax=Wickerhamomyces ciferrii (strain ATCC 14091 / BCRC 22168 / CBS 111 / JCM 3599 / NBRC 0793 / NRRL Y-1031 F-60-10) TaxID=1206466 RepID=K0KSE2_WICCF|nr:putative transcriptional regulatory protein [Wickerhamomyces ciferrii]CCH44249.1 putative transcriptional regulatory protein [Wickerhamomyces ciferrii]